MIRSVSLRNFQSHKDTNLDLLPGVNVIVGSSNSGKTAILRALSWAITNRPSGTAYVSYWNRDKKDMPKDPTEVVVGYDEDMVTRRRSADFNGYVLNSYDDAPVEFEAVGTDVPEAVSARLNVGPVNVQRQMDAPFLLSESAADVARFLNTTIRLDLIDRVLSRAESKRRQIKRDHAATESRVAVTKREIEAFAWTDKASAILDSIDIMEADAKKREDDGNAIRAMIVGHKAMTDRLARYAMLDKAVAIVSEIDDVVEKRAERADEKAALTSLLRSHDSFSQSRDIMARYDKARTVCATIDAILANSVENERRVLSDRVHEHVAALNKVALVDDELSDALKRMPDTCPTCGRPL